MHYVLLISYGSVCFCLNLHGYVILQWKGINYCLRCVINVVRKYYADNVNTLSVVYVIYYFSKIACTFPDIHVRASKCM